MYYIIIYLRLNKNAHIQWRIYQVCPGVLDSPFQIQKKKKKFLQYK